MKVVITGGTGFVGQRLASRLLQRGVLVGPDGSEVEIDELVLFDVAQPLLPLPADKRLSIVTGDIADAAQMRALVTSDTASIFHLAAIVSGHAEADMDIGLRVNLDGTRAVLEAARALGTAPRLVFASSLAVYGGEMPPQVSEKVPLTPQTSYGTHKAIGELLVSDYSRKGFVDGRSLRLPTIVVRPGRPNRAASSFASGIIREPLSGVEAICPVSPEAVMPILSPRRIVEAFIHAHDLPASAYGGNRSLQLPGISPTVGEMVEALRRVAGAEVVKRIRWQRDPVIERIVATWPIGLDAGRAEAMGFVADRSVDEMIEAFIADDLDAQKAMISAG
jgi:nucleoside-diphosphate-sugar epimerase